MSGVLGGRGVCLISCEKKKELIISCHNFQLIINATDGNNWDANDKTDFHEIHNQLKRKEIHGTINVTDKWAACNSKQKRRPCVAG